MGRKADNLRVGYRRFEHRSHIVFYVNEDDGITIIRVIHQSRNVPELLA